MSTTEDILPANEPVVRIALPEDGARVLELVGKLGHAVAPDPQAFQDSFSQALADSPRTIVHVAEVAGEVVGYALTTINTLFYTNGPSAQLQEIVVDDARQTSGVGTALVRAVEAACEGSGVTQLTVASRRAGGFYDRLGYTQQAEYMRRLF
ncbi:MAG: GNAT family N-acetyltransferase [Microbacteriaceae bacterium]|nr:GNAT family N-acetyltransferase [Microbacteriaceae bacterium]